MVSFGNCDALVLRLRRDEKKFPLRIEILTPPRRIESPQSETQSNSTHHVNTLATSSCSYWLENISHQGLAAFNSNPSGYQVFRNVKDFGAKGDGELNPTPFPIYRSLCKC